MSNNNKRKAIAVEPHEWNWILGVKENTTDYKDEYEKKRKAEKETILIQGLDKAEIITSLYTHGEYNEEDVEMTRQF